MYTNIDSIKNKADLFTLYVVKVNPHVIAITETRLSNSDLSGDFFRLKDYVAYRKDRAVEDGGGGVIILVRDDILSEATNENFLSNTESVACKIFYGNKSLLIACIYRPPKPSDTHYNSNINTVIDKLSQLSSDQLLICGDFNYPNIDWPNNIVLANELSNEQLFYNECQMPFFTSMLLILLDKEEKMSHPF